MKGGTPGKAPSGLRRAALRGTLWSGLQQVGDRGFRILIYLVLARLVAPDAFGLVALSAVFIEVGYILVNQGLTSAVIQRESLERGHLDAAFWGGVVFSTAVASLVLFGAPLIARISREEGIEPIVRWLSLSFPIAAATGVQEAVLRRELRYRVLAIRSFISQFVAGVVSLTVAVLGYGVWSLVALELVRRTVSLIVLWSVSEWRPGRSATLRHYVELLRFGVHIMGVAVVNFVRNRSDYYLIGAFLGTTALGFYSIARQLVNAVTQLVNGSVVEVMWATYSRLQAEPERLARAIVRATELLATIAWPLYLIGFVLAGEIVAVALGDTWTTSVPIVRAFLLCSAILVVTVSLLTAVTALGDSRLRLRLESLVAVLTLIAIAIALPFGIEAVAWAYAGTFVLLFPIQVLVSLRRLPVRPTGLGTRLASPAFAAAVMMGAVAGTRVLVAGRLSPVPLLALLAATGVVAYAATLLLVAPAQVRLVRNDIALLARRRLGDVEATDGTDTDPGSGG